MTPTIAVVSTALPPGHSGQAVVLERLLRERDASFWFFSDEEATFTQAPEDRMGEYRLLRPLLFGLSMRDLPGLLGDVNAHLGAMRPIRIRGADIIEALGKAKPDVVIGCSGNPFDLPAAALVAERLGGRFFAYLFDDPVYQWPAGRQRDVVRRLETSWARRADALICPNEALAGALARRTGRTPVVIRNPMDDALAQAASRECPKPFGDPVRILYGGAIADSQGDALANLAEVVRREGGRIELHIFTQQSDRQLAMHGLAGPHIVRHNHVSPAEIAAEQRAADILFLPLAFHSSIHDVLMISSPGKLGEYLASRRPILVHAPKNSFLAGFMQAHQAGLVVDTPCVEALADAVKALCGSAALRASLVAAATKASKAFSEKSAREQFWKLVTDA